MYVSYHSLPLLSTLFSFILFIYTIFTSSIKNFFVLFYKKIQNIYIEADFFSHVLQIFAQYYAISSAIFIISVKVCSLSFALVASPVIKWSLTVKIASAFTSYFWARVYKPAASISTPSTP